MSRRKGIIRIESILSELEEYLRAYIAQRGFPPVMRDITEHFHISTSQVAFALDRLAENGVITRRRGDPRTIHFVTSDRLFNVIVRTPEGSARATARPMLFEKAVDYEAELVARYNAQQRCILFATEGEWTTITVRRDTGEFLVEYSILPAGASIQVAS